MAENFNRIMEGLGDVLEIVEGRAAPESYRVHVPEKVDVKAIRDRLKLTQAGFAERFGFSIGAVRDWEQDRRTPEKSARALLTIIDREPAAVERALGPITADT